MNSVSSATNQSSRPAGTTAGELVSHLQFVVMALRNHNMPLCAETVEQAITRLNRGTYRRHFVCVSTLAQMIDEGRTRREIAEFHNTCEATISRWCKNFGLSTPDRPRQAHWKALPAPTGPREWTAEEDQKLIAFWTEGDSIRDIACQLGNRTINSVIGRVHRLGLPARPSPIRR